MLTRIFPKFKGLYNFSTSIVNNFGVVGSGQMGTGIAIVANVIGKLPVTIVDSN
jgi:hypothetical protein